MPSALTIRSVPPAVGALPAPVQETSGKYTVITSPEDADHPWAKPGLQTDVWSTVRFVERRSTQVPPWSALSSFSTALRVRKGHESGDWTPLTSEAESKLRQQLVSYAHLDDNWDGDGAKTPSQAAINDALTFLNGRPADIPLPKPEEGTEGDVGVYWDHSHAHVFAEVSFEGDGTYAYFAVHGVPGAVTEKCGNDDMDAAAPWPHDMLRILRIQDPT